MAVATAVVVSSLQAQSRCFYSLRVAPGECLIREDRTVAAVHGRALLGGTILESRPDIGRITSPRWIALVVVFVGSKRFFFAYL